MGLALSFTVRVGRVELPTPTLPGLRPLATAGKSVLYVGIPRFELGTSTLSVWRSNQLSYMPAIYYYSAPLPTEALAKAGNH